MLFGLIKLFCEFLLYCVYCVGLFCFVCVSVWFEFVGLVNSVVYGSCFVVCVIEVCYLLILWLLGFLVV